MSPDQTIFLRPAKSGSPPPRPASAPAHRMLITDENVLGLALLVGGVGVMFQTTVPLISITSALILALSTAVLLRGIQLAVTVGRVRLDETVARAMPLEIPIGEWGETEKFIATEGHQLQEANGDLGTGDLGTFGRLNARKGDIDPANTAHGEQHPAGVRTGFDGAYGPLNTLKNAFKNGEIRRARADLLPLQAGPGAEDRHVTESVLAFREFSRRVRRTTEWLNQAPANGAHASLQS